MKKNSNSYPLLYRWAFACGREKEFLTPSQIASIPRSTRSSWRSINDERLKEIEQGLKVGGNLKFEEQKHLEFWENREEVFKRAILINRRLIDYVGQSNYHALLEDRVVEFVHFVESQRDVFRLKDLLRWFSISVPKYRNWKSRVEYECQSSLGQLCARQHPLQLAPKECNTIQKSLSQQRFKHWPRTAVHSYLLRKGSIGISRSTFYKYASRFAPTSKNLKKKPPYKPIRADKPDAYWHLDISVYYTEDDKRCLIYALFDNYSRKVLAWRCSLGTARKELVGEMLLDVLNERRPEDLVLLSDGGPENVNSYMRNLVFEYASSTGKHFKHEIAMATIRKSNSMMERFFRIMKYDYLFHNKPSNIDELHLVLERMFHEYNYVRPHYSLDHRTPDEAYRGVPPLNFRNQLMESRQKRFDQNKNCACQVCICEE